jgi:hypothetical protein
MNSTEYIGLIIDYGTCLWEMWLGSNLFENMEPGEGAD